MSEGKGRFSVGQMVTVLANLGVIVGLIFVVVELQQTRTSLQAEIELTLAEGYAGTMMDQISDPEVTRLVMKAYLAPETLQADEFVRFMGFVSAQTSRAYAAWRLKEIGAIDEDVWEQHGRFHANSFPTQWSREFWSSTNAGMYPEELLAAVRELMPEGEMEMFDPETDFPTGDAPPP